MAILLASQESGRTRLPQEPRSRARSMSDTNGFDVADSPPSTSVLNIDLSVNRLPDPTYHDFLAARDTAEYTAVDSTLREFYRGDNYEPYERFHNCRRFAFFARHAETGKVKVLASSCHNRWCPPCASAKASHFSDKLNDWLARRKHPRQLELTLRSTSQPLREQTDELYRCWRSLRLDPEFKKTFLAGVWFFQVTYNAETGLWHPHLHCLFVGKFCPQMAISRKWEQITNGSTYVYVQAVRDACTSARYVSRYVARPMLLSDLPEDRRLELVDAMYHRRTAGTFGRDGLRPDLSIPKQDLTQYVRLCSWSELREMIAASSVHARIYRAWLSQEPIPEALVYPLINLNRKIPEIKPNPPPAAVAGLFDGLSATIAGHSTGNLRAIYG